MKFVKESFFHTLLGFPLIQINISMEPIGVIR